MRYIWIALVLMTSANTVYPMNDNRLPSLRSQEIIVHTYMHHGTKTDAETIDNDRTLDVLHKKQKLNPQDHDVVHSNHANKIEPINKFLSHAPPINIDNLPAVPLHTCNNCQYQTAVETEFAQHMLTHENTNGSINPIATLPPNTNINTLLDIGIQALMDDRKLLVCTHPGCGKTFTSYSGLRMHRLDHETNPEKQRPFQCHLCMQRFKQQGHLDLHVSQVHEGIRHYCAYKDCEVSYARKSDLDLHVKFVHQNKPKIKCRFCGYATSRPSNLRMHENIHTRAILHYCAKCGKDFTRYDAKNVHEARCKQGLQPLIHLAPDTLIGLNNSQSNQQQN